MHHQSVSGMWMAVILLSMYVRARIPGPSSKSILFMRIWSSIGLYVLDYSNPAGLSARGRYSTHSERENWISWQLAQHSDIMILSIHAVLSCSLSSSCLFIRHQTSSYGNSFQSGTYYQPISYRIVYTARVVLFCRSLSPGTYFTNHRLSPRQVMYKRS